MKKLKLMCAGSIGLSAFALIMSFCNFNGQISEPLREQAVSFYGVLGLPVGAAVAGLVIGVSAYAVVNALLASKIE